MLLFKINHEVFPMWVVAPSWQAAIDSWRLRALELLLPPFEFDKNENPESVTLIATEEEVAIYHEDTKA